MLLCTSNPPIGECIFMKVLLFGRDSECKPIFDFLKCSDNTQKYSYIQTDDSDELLKMLTTISPELVIIVADGAFGMEKVIATRKLCPDTKLFWFSDDKNFGAQAYRLDCNYFSAKPITEQKLFNAIEKLKAC